MAVPLFGRFRAFFPGDLADRSLGISVLSDGRLTLLVTEAGTGFAATREHALTRWRGDTVEDGDGVFVYIRDRESGEFWSVGRRPIPSPEEKYEARRRPGVFTIVRRADGIEARMEVAVPPDSATEVRRITLVNRSAKRRRIEITSYAEVVLDRPEAFAAHPAFSKLFVETASLPGESALLAARRPRSSGEHHPLMFQALVGEGSLEWESDRARFLGRGGSPEAPRALLARSPLSGSAGAVLDPVFVLRRSSTIEPGEAARFLLLLGAAETREAAIEAVRARANRIESETDFTASEDATRREIARLGLEPREAEALEDLGGALLYRVPSLGAASSARASSRGQPADLLRLGVSPDEPFLLLRADEGESASLVPDLLRALRYWNSLGLPIRAVVLSADPSAIEVLARTERPEGLLILPRGEVPVETVDLLTIAARAVVPAGPEIANAPDDAPRRGSKASVPPESREEPATPPSSTDPTDSNLLLFNGFGGFAPDGREYVIRLPHRAGSGLRLPPAPWVHVIANDRIGFLVSERGAGATWGGNSRENRLTPWSNDPVRDPHGEALYVRDEESGAFWSPLPGPAPAAADYEMRYGFGYALCRHESRGLEQETCLFAADADPVKIARVRITNRSGRTRRISVVSYRRLVLGTIPERTGRFLVTEIDPGTGAVFAENRMAEEGATGTVFSAVAARGGIERIAATADRAAFLGHAGTPERPAALLRPGLLAGRFGAGLDPCVAEQAVLAIAPGECAECSFLFGEAEERAEAHALVDRYRSEGAVDRALREVRSSWERLLSGLRVRTPEPALDLLVNGWLPYQAIACRLKGRSAFYQSGGAFGFRDQLQDASCLVYFRPEETRRQILLHAEHQFVEGDVLHWWHPPRSRGIRTRFADDLLWLPSITTFYIRSTGDRAILEERARFLAARALAPGEDEAFLEPVDSGESGTLYEHCVRAIDRSLATGPHGLPLFGGGDWNDGMNRVGRGGKGESVWMGFFLFDVLGRFLPLCEARSDDARAERYRAARDRLRSALDDAGWDGEWYRRGFYDDGTPLGSSRNRECRIDALVQAWSVLSGAAPRERAERAMDAVERHLVSEKDGIIRLLTPPFDKTPRDPGYIKGYVPGVRENGGQYTHAALWVVQALAELGRRNRAAKLLAMLSPASRSRTPEEVMTYKVEPFVIAADVYGEPPHVGRGGWTWYTGSAAWMHRIAIESILGLRLQNGDSIRLRPSIPDEWPGFEIAFRPPGGDALVRIAVENPMGIAQRVAEATLDGAAIPVEEGAVRIPLPRDGKEHDVRVVLGP